jgi:hypothetical protein
MPSVRVAGKYHRGGAGRERRVERDELGIQRDLGSRERFWRRLCRRGYHDRYIRRPNNSDQSSPATHERRTLTAHGFRIVHELPKHEFLCRHRLDQAV